MTSIGTTALHAALRAALAAKKTTKASIHAATGISLNTLGKLVGGADVSLKTSKLEALHAHLAYHGFPFLRHANLAAALDRSDQIRVLLTFYHDHDDPFRRLCSPWDVRAADEIRSSARRPSLTDRVTLHRMDEDQPLRIAASPGKTRTSWICLGSPRATIGFDDFCYPLTRFRTGRDEREIKLPAKFYWAGYESTSRHVLTDAEFRHRFGRRCDVSKVRSALVFEDGSPPLLECKHPDERLPGRFESYALVLARRLADGSMRIAVAGLTGPATAAAASLLLDLEFAVPPPAPSEPPADSPLACYVVRAAIVGDSLKTLDDLREVDPENVSLARVPAYHKG